MAGSHTAGATGVVTTPPSLVTVTQAFSLRVKSLTQAPQNSLPVLSNLQLRHPLILHALQVFPAVATSTPNPSIHWLQERAPLVRVANLRQF